MLSAPRSFVSTLGAFAALPLLPRTRVEPDVILYNGSIWTVDDQLPRAQALAISDGRIFAIGSNDEVLLLATANTRKVDLSWKTVLHPYHDAHSHPIYSGVNHLKKVACDKDTIEAIQQGVHERAEKTPTGQSLDGFLTADG